MELLNKYYTKTIAFETEFKKRECYKDYYDKEKERMFKGFQSKNQEYYVLAVGYLEVCYKYEQEFRFEIPKDLSTLSNKDLFGKLIKFYQRIIRLILFFGVTHSLSENCDEKIDEMLTICMNIITDLHHFLVKRGEIKN